MADAEHHSNATCLFGGEQDVTLKPGLGRKIGFNEIDTSSVGIRPQI